MPNEMPSHEVQPHSHTATTGNRSYSSYSISSYSISSAVELPSRRQCDDIQCPLNYLAEVSRGVSPLNDNAWILCGHRKYIGCGCGCGCPADVALSQSPQLQLWFLRLPCCPAQPSWVLRPAITLNYKIPLL